MFAEDVVESYWTALELRILDAELRQTFLNKSIHFADLRNAAEVALHISHKTRYTGLAECLRHHL